MNIFKNNGTNYFILFVISLLTLNNQDHSVNAGLDGSYFWAFNYLISHQANNLDKITFIYGPLAFLHSTVYYGWLIIFGVLYQMLAKFVYGWAMYKLSLHLTIKKELALLLFFISCLVIFSTEAWLNMLVILLMMLFSYERKNYLLIIVAFVSMFGYYFKCSIGLSAVLFQGIFFLHDAFTKRKIDIHLLLRIILYNATFFIVIGLILFRSLVPVFDSLQIYYKNIVMFNETSSFYNGNDNIILLILCFIALISVFYINTAQEFKLFWWMIFFFLFMGYTHSIVRMDHSHYMGFLIHLFLAIVCCGLFYRNTAKNTFVLLGISFFSFYGNLSSKKDFSEFFLAIPNGPSNVVDYVFKLGHEKTKSKIRSAANLKINHQLPATWVQEINKKKIDFFPWDFGYIEANKLINWKPRPYLQSLNMSSWFDRNTAAYFKSDAAPEYIIWHAGNSIEFLEGIDNSYLMNNEFYTVTSLISNYSVIQKTNDKLLLKKTATPCKIWVKDISEKTEINCNEWIELPEHENVLGCSINYDFNFLRDIKKQFYRDDEFFIEYKTNTGLKIKKRIWPGDAKDFVWLNPYIKNSNDSTGWKEIKAIRFSNTNPQIHSGKLKIQFKSLIFEQAEPINSKNALKKWFSIE